jgi:hypothetical protein
MSNYTGFGDGVARPEFAKGVERTGVHHAHRRAFGRATLFELAGAAGFERLCVELRPGESLPGLVADKPFVLVRA